MLVRAALLLIGFTAVIAQIVLLRELIVVFSGNEMSLGLALASWLLWTAFGSSVLSRMAAARRRPRLWMAALEALAGLALPLAILLLRASRGIFQAAPGELLGPGPMLAASFAALAAFCSVSGWLFAAGTRLYSSKTALGTGRAGGAVYLLEAIGSAIGGLLASLVLIRYLGSFEIAALLLWLNLLVAASLAIGVRTKAGALALGAVSLLLLAALPTASHRLEAVSLATLWRGFKVGETRNSIYGNLVLVETEASVSLYENGLVLFDVPNPEAAEESVHYALLQHPSPKAVLLIGGGVNGSAAEALKHASVETLDYVELDPAVLDMARRHFAREWAPIEADRRVRVHHTDGRLFVKSGDAKFDVIVLNLPDPQTAQLNRFYTVEFFRAAARRLSPGGVFSFRLTGAENYISPELARFLRSIRKTLASVFPNVASFPGSTIHFFATRDGALTTGAEQLAARLRERRLRTTYVREHLLPFRLMPDRMRDLEAQIEPQADTPLNADFAPIAYYFCIALWSVRFHRELPGWFEAVDEASFPALAAAGAVVLFGLAVWFLWALPAERREAAAAGFSTGVMGFSLIGLQMLLLLGFQATHGYLYHQLAIVIGCFMAGMAAGSWLGLRRQSGAGSELRRLAWLQALAAASGLALVALFDRLAPVRSGAGLFLVSQVAFPLLAAGCGLLGGLQFPIASRVFFKGSNGRSPGTLYGLDLVGACLGAALFGTVLIPVFGFHRTAALMAVLNAAPAAVSAALSRSQPGARR